MITNIAHVCYTVKDLQASIAFYVEKLGMRRAFDYRNDKGELTGVYLYMGGRSFIEMFQGEVAPKAEKQSFVHLCLEVEDFEGTVAELTRRGVACTPARLGLDRSWQTHITDPDGNAIELHGYTEESKQVAAMK
jgi:catechol 2,3-dioxygenase-like lactoylglutathione lyase family enzyme